MAHDISPEERDAIVVEWHRQAAEPLPANAGPLGCTVAVLGIGALAVLPVLLRLFGLAVPPAAGILLLMALGILIVGGLTAGAFGGSRGRHAARAQVDAALNWLAAHPEGDEPVARRTHAVTLILRAHHVDGPTSVTLLDVAEARRRLGPARGYVDAVERVLREAVGAWPVFTDAGGTAR